jgi:hypothetical protein
MTDTAFEDDEVEMLLREHRRLAYSLRYEPDNEIRAELDTIEQKLRQLRDTKPPSCN